MCKVSVIIPVYNVEKYIRNMLQSVRSQSFKDFEAVIVNDGLLRSSVSLTADLGALISLTKEWRPQETKE